MMGRSLGDTLVITGGCKPFGQVLPDVVDAALRILHGQVQVAPYLKLTMTMDALASERLLM